MNSDTNTNPHIFAIDNCSLQILSKSTWWAYAIVYLNWGK